jgi:CBS domain-containing membrane protein
MSRDIDRIGQSAPPEEARRLQLDHGVRTLPVLDDDDHVVGSVGLRELAQPGGRIAELMSPASTSRPDVPALDLRAPLTDGRTHAVVIVGEGRRLLGMVTQTDLLAALARMPHVSLRDPERPDFSI